MAVLVKGGGGKPEEEKTVTAGTSAIVVNPSSGKVMKKVTVNPTPTESKSVTPTTSELTVTPSEGKHLSQVVVGAVEDVTPEVTAQTPVIAQIAENLGVTITTPSGTNKQILQGNNANLLNIKNNAKKAGLYVWKKCKSAPDLTMTITQLGEPLYVKVTCDDPSVDLSNVYASYFIGYSGILNSGETPITLTFGEDGMVLLQWMGVNSNTKPYSYDASTQTLTINNNFPSSTKPSDVFTKVAKEFIECVVSDDDSKYPNGGIKDGYWYEKVKNGEIEYGTVTLASEQNSVQVSHTLGKTPSYAYLIHTDLANSYRTKANLNGAAFRGYGSEYQFTQGRIIKSASGITFLAYSDSSNYYFATGTYIWFVLA